MHIFQCEYSGTVQSRERESIQPIFKRDITTET